MTHWTEELFKEHPELFLGAFEARLEQSYDEVAGLLHCLSEQGFQPQRLLDLNCGIGRHSIELAKQGIRVVGTDISPDYIDIATEMAAEQGVADRAGFRVADMRRIAAEMENEKPFDGVVCLWTAFGFYDEETNIDVLRQCRGLVGEGGAWRWTSSTATGWCRTSRGRASPAGKTASCWRNGTSTPSAPAYTTPGLF